MKYYFTSESVTEGHPDKICDKISDKILDTALSIDKNSRMAVEATIKDDLVLIYGEASTSAKIDYKEVAKSVLKDIGYDEDFEVIVKVSVQSSEIFKAAQVGAGDQGIMFGYACNETKELMPLPIMLANNLARKLTSVRKGGADFLKPDGKTEVTVQYVDDVPVSIDTIIIAQQHTKNTTQEFLREYLIENVINKVIPSSLMTSDTKIYINTSGSFVIGGPFGDSGTTGRKIIVDTYGGMGRVGGGCFSSKDPSKVDRSAAYYARYVAKNIVANKYADKCEIQVSYAIGKEKPVSIYINTFNSELVKIDKIYDYIDNNFDFSVSNIITELDLYNVKYYDTASYGHFGNESYNWEKIKE